MGDWIAGVISTRRLGVLLKGLPEDSALHRARTDGHVWTTMHAMTWLLVKEATSNTALWRARLRIKGKDKTKWPKYPWSTKDQGKRYGRVNEGDSQAALTYLMSLSPKPTDKE